MKLCVSEIQDGNVVIGKARIISTSLPEHQKPVKKTKYSSISTYLKLQSHSFFFFLTNNIPRKRASRIKYDEPDCSDLKTSPSNPLTQKGRGLDSKC